MNRRKNTRERGMTVKTVAIVGTFDTKARELQYIKALIEEKGDAGALHQYGSV